MAWADDAEVDAWLERASLGVEHAEFYRGVLADTRSRGFSVPMQAMAEPAIADAISRVREEPTADDAEQHLADVLQQTDEMLVVFDELSPADKVVFKTVAAPIFDPIGRVLLSLSITGPEHPVRVDEVLELGRRLVRSAAVATRQGSGPGARALSARSSSACDDRRFCYSNSEMFDLTGRVVVVSGGNAGIGLGFARGIARAGGDVVDLGSAGREERRGGGRAARSSAAACSRSRSTSATRRAWSRRWPRRSRRWAGSTA